MSKSAHVPSAEKSADADSPEVKIEARPEAVKGEASNQKMFAIEIGGETFKQPGKDSREAWALFCDGRKKWPSPKSAKITEVK